MRNVVVMFGGRRSPFNTADDPLRIGSCRAPELFDCLLHTCLRMAREQLQNPHIMPDAGPRTVPLFQTLTQFLKHRRQLPLAIDVRVIERCRSTF